MRGEGTGDGQVRLLGELDNRTHLAAHLISSPHQHFLHLVQHSTSTKALMTVARVRTQSANNHH